jgi:hypothetical protein
MIDIYSYVYPNVSVSDELVSLDYNGDDYNSHN